MREERHAGKKILNCPRERNEFVVARARSRVSEWWTRILRRMRARGTPRNSCQALKALFPFSYRDYRLLAPLSLLGSRARLPYPRRVAPASPSIADACSRRSHLGLSVRPASPFRSPVCRLTTSRSHPFSFLLFLQTSGSTLPSLNYLL